MQCQTKTNNKQQVKPLNFTSMENVRVLYINPQTADMLEENPFLFTNEEFEEHAESYSLSEFEEAFNNEQISDLGYLRIIEK